ncbi:Nucleotide-binding universal stress protein, UspA family [Quadrisphaera granulorum]|uniref:Nucleotide-binding universal stress UspA family protein n=1 Tax=Quadrisphaera granulorum TaxID=317664 RepID=A0A315ZNS0_9ACTN|nr:universal stress protein [Quadrisphaera granulorum]PWJ46919.1 nucleotide-binding universal stress UspA family protein [Quadrisphaera granulorum]SZE99011.1 Nucleotide-binding universal stress protein, UspA family [Quadrisphaera granulorum]
MSTLEQHESATRPEPPPPGRHHVVVGWDGSEGAVRALHWACEEAERLGAPLRVVVCIAWHPVASAETAGAILTPPDLRRLGEQLAAQAVTRVRGEHPGVQVSSVVHDWAAAVPALLDESGAARLMVLGSRGHGAFADLLLGSTSAQVAVHARCPVVVVRPPERGADGPSGTTTTAGRRVVVGADTSPAARCALRFALQAAATRGAEVTAVRAWQPPSLWGSGQIGPALEHVEALEQAQAELLDEVVREAQAAADAEGVVVHQRVVRNHPATALLQAAQAAELLVVGSRGSGGFRGLLLGSVSRAVLHHAHGPVALVHTPLHQ